MKVCMILEGCYPYVRGGVSTWVHQYIQKSTDIEFVLWTIHAKSEDALNSLYELPPNITGHCKLILDEAYSGRGGGRRVRPGDYEAIAQALRRILFEESGDWDGLIDILQRLKPSGQSIMKSRAFLELAREVSERNGRLGLSEAYYGLQSVLIPICHVLVSDIPQADLYHSAVTGFGGLLGALAAHKTGKPFVLTEHGIYPREREEELITADWTVPAMRSIWTSTFYEMSRCAYRSAEYVTSLFQEASARQVSIGCNPDKCRVVPNGIDVQRFQGIPIAEHETEINIGAFVRFAQIKDLKTMIHAFYTLKQRIDGVKLYIMGGTDDESYRDTCLSLISRLGLQDSVIVAGHVDAIEYMKKMDFTVLSSISEGQPLTILESMAAGRPCVATKVGNCVGLLEEPINGTGSAGFCCTPMMPEELANSMEKLCVDKALRREMGENGQKRVLARYTLDKMLNSYHEIYREALEHGRNRI